MGAPSGPDSLNARFVSMKRGGCRKGVNGPEKSLPVAFPRCHRRASRFMRLAVMPSMRERRFFHTFANSWEALDNG